MFFWPKANQRHRCHKKIEIKKRCKISMVCKNIHNILCSNGQQTFLECTLPSFIRHVQKHIYIHTNTHSMQVCMSPFVTCLLTRAPRLNRLFSTRHMKTYSIQHPTCSKHMQTTVKTSVREEMLSWVKCSACRRKFTSDYTRITVSPQFSGAIRQESLMSVIWKRQISGFH